MRRTLVPLALGAALGLSAAAFVRPATAAPILLAAPAHAADRADDWILTIDRESSGPVIKRRLSFEQGMPIPAADWPGMRSAAATSLASLDGWFDSYQNGAWNAWWDGFTTNQKEAARQAVLLGS